MKSLLATLVIALITGYLGGISSGFFQPEPAEQTRAEQDTDLSRPVNEQTQTGDLTIRITHLQQRINRLEIQLDEIANKQASITDSRENKTTESTDKNARPGRTLVPDRDILVSTGIHPDIADDLLRRISQQEFRRLELRNLLQRNAATDMQQYRDELRELNQYKISLRSELGDDAYDRYLLLSGQNNRVTVSSVMAESPAEINGIQKGDVILYYDDQKVFNVSDLRRATLDGEIGSYTNIVIFRDGMPVSLIVPRGTLGLQLEATQSDPAQER